MPVPPPQSGDCQLTGRYRRFTPQIPWFWRAITSLGAGAHQGDEGVAGHRQRHGVPALPAAQHPRQEVQRERPHQPQREYPPPGWAGGRQLRLGRGGGVDAQPNLLSFGVAFTLNQTWQKETAKKEMLRKMDG